MTQGKYYRFYCEICNWNKVVEGLESSGLHELPVSPIPRGSPKRNAETKAYETPKPHTPPRRFRCPGCGRVIIPKSTAVPPAKKPEEDGPDAAAILTQNVEERARRRIEGDPLDPTGVLP
jgi:transcription elongation factor Elf1